VHRGVNLLGRHRRSLQDNRKMCLKETDHIMMVRTRFAWLRISLVKNFGTLIYFGPIRGGVFLDQLRYYQLLKKESVPRN
jgi:hypothetical protein